MHNDEDNHPTTGTTAQKRQTFRHPPPADVNTPGNVAFRLLCQKTLCGAVIGTSGTVIKLLEQQTSCKIRFEKSVPRCDERIVSVVAAEFPKRTYSLKRCNEVENHQQKEEIGEDIEISPAQHGLIRVLERVWEVEEEDEEMFPTTGVGVGSVMCKLLAHTSQVGYLMGHGGNRIKKIRDDYGAKIRVSKTCPACAPPTDELIEIKGDSLAVKKSVLAVSQCFHDSPPLYNTQMVGDWPSTADFNGSSSDPYYGVLHQQASFVSPGVSSSVDYPSTRYSMPGEEEVVIRLICSEDSIGGLIGKGGTNVKALEAETGASISVASPVTESDDRVIHISAFESMESQYSPVQMAVIRVFTKSVEIGHRKSQESGPSSLPKVDARLLVSKDQVGCLIGKGGTIISEMRKATHTGMWLSTDEVPPCAAENDAVIRINGWVHNVQAALFRVSGRLRDTFFPHKTTKPARKRDPISYDPYPSEDISHNPSHQDSLTESMHHLGISHSSMRSGGNLRGFIDTERGDLQHGIGSKSAVVRTTTLEISVPAYVLGSAFEEKENNLNRLRQISGAKVMVHEPYPGATEMTVIISGTPVQTRAAQSVLHAFTLSSSTGR